jgi:hypothetical protein
MKPLVVSINPLFVIVLTLSLLYNEAHPHNFYKNEPSVFFTWIKQAEVENELVRSNFPGNSSVALEHAENAAKLLKDIFYFDEDNSDDSDFRKTYDRMKEGLNSTTNALIVANLADQILKQYGMALGFNSSVVSNLANMSMMNMSLSNYPSGENNSGAGMMSMGGINQQMNSTTANNLDRNNTVVDQVDYQTATKLADSLKNLFLLDLRNATLPNSTGLMRMPLEIKTASVNDLGMGIDNLISAIQRKSSLEEVASIVHGQIHPNVFIAFNLKLLSD